MYIYRPTRTWQHQDSLLNKNTYKSAYLIGYAPLAGDDVNMSDILNYTHRGFWCSNGQIIPCKIEKFELNTVTYARIIYYVMQQSSDHEQTTYTEKYYQASLSDNDQIEFIPMNN